MIFAGLTLPSLIGDHHFLFNLEPYPDGLLYALSARNFAMGHGLQLIYQQSNLALWVPPLYSLILSLGYLINSAPQVFYVVNVLLGGVTIVLLWLVLQETTSSWWIKILGVGLYLSHAYIVWLPSVPMSENAALPLFLLALYGLLKKKFTFIDLVVCIFGTGGLLLTRYSLIGVVAALSFWLAIRTGQSKSLQIKVFAAVGFLVSLILFLIYLVSIHTSVVSLLGGILQQLHSGGRFNNLRFVNGNMQQYAGILLGKQAVFLWLSFPLTSLGVSAAAILSLLYEIWQSEGEQRLRSFFLITCFISQFLALLIFYVVDERYILLTVPIFVISCCWGIDQLLLHLQGRKKLLLLVAIGVVLGLQLVSQLKLYEEIIGSNLLHHTEAWQYQAIKDISAYFKNKPTSEVITALPPFLVAAYNQNSFSVLPLSSAQEFISKDQFVWGKDVLYTNLLNGYAQMLQTGKDLYITNAYVTQQQQVIQDYETYKQKFNLTLVHEGCQQTCNIYQISLKK